VIPLRKHSGQNRRSSLSIAFWKRPPSGSDWALIKANGEKKTGTITVPDNATLLTFTDTNLNDMAVPEDGIMITAKMADMLGVSTGDEITTLSKEFFEDLGFTFKATSILTGEKVNREYEGITSILSTSDIVAGWDELTEAMMLMVYILIAAAVILSVVVLYNLGLLSFTEMEREMATLKVIGLKSGKLRSLLLTQNIWFSVIGFIFGMPAGMLLVDVICQSSGESFDFPIRLHLTNLMLSFAITFGLSVFVNLLFSRKIKKLNMVEALKGVE